MTDKQCRALYLLLAGFLAGASLVHCFSSFTLSEKKNTVLLASVKDSLLHDKKPEEWAALKEQQEKVLLARPADAYAWTRLSYLRFMTNQPSAEVFAALKMADGIAPNEPRLLVERAMLWRQFYDPADVQAKERLASLWRMAFKLQPTAVMIVAEDNGVAKEIAASLSREDAVTFYKWRGRR